MNQACIGLGVETGRPVSFLALRSIGLGECVEGRDVRVRVVTASSERERAAVPLWHQGHWSGGAV